MEKNIMQLLNLEDWFSIYFNNRMKFLVVWIVFCFIAFLYVYTKMEKKDYIKIIKQNAGYIFIAITLGLLLQFIGIKLYFTIDYMPIFIFSLFVLITTSTCIHKSSKYKKAMLKQHMKMLKVFIVGILGEIFLLSVMNRLDCIEVMAATISNIFLDITGTYLKELIDKKERETIPNDLIAVDQPVEDDQDLFMRRSFQLDNFIRMFNEICDYDLGRMGEWQDQFYKGF